MFLPWRSQSERRAEAINRNRPRVEFDSDGLVAKVHLPEANGGGTRLFERQGGNLTRIYDVDGAGKLRREIYPSQTDGWKAIVVNNDGSFDYINREGRYVRWQANDRIIEHNADRTLRSVTLADGSRREFEYDENKKVSSIRDTKIVRAGSQIEEWRQVGNSDRLAPVSRTPWNERSSITLHSNNSGDYTYMAADGRHHVAKTSDLALRNLDSPPVNTARARLEQLVASSGLNVTQFKSYMNQFELRCENAFLEGRKSPNTIQISQAYKGLADLLEPGKSKYFTPAYCKRIAMQTMANLANPEKFINQGVGTKTCTMATAETFTAFGHPEKYVDLILQMAHTGEYRTTRNSVIRPLWKAIRPGKAQEGWDPDSGKDVRNIPSRIFQATACTLFRPGYIHGSPGLRAEHSVAAAREITGHWMPCFLRGHLPSAKELLYLKSLGVFPIGICTQQRAPSGHIQTILDVRERFDNRQKRNVVEVYLNDSHGAKSKVGWVSLEKLHRRQLERGERKTA
jgi:YD repeat-containing protein